jgi:ATP-dependent Lhr-like helicase
VAKGVIIGMDSDDTLEALTIARRALNEDLEPVKIPPKPYDALTHQIAGLLMKNRRLTFSEILEIAQNAYPYRELTMEDIEKALKYMHQRFPRLAWVSSEDQVVLKPLRTKALFEYYFDNLSMIPVEKQFLVVEDSSDSSIGVLDEAFMAEYGKIGTKFIIRGSPWQIVNTTEDKVYVRAVEDPTGAIPSWIGEEIPVPFQIAQEVALIRGFVEEKTRKGQTVQEISVLLSERYPADKETIARAISETAEQVQSGLMVPTEKRLVLEDWEDFVIVHSNFGSLINRAFAQLLGQALSEKLGRGMVVQHDPYRIFMQTVGAASSASVLKSILELSNTPEQAVNEMLRRSTVKTGLFKRRIIQVARRFGALKKWADFSNVSLHKLIKSYEGTPIYDEGLKEVFMKDLDAEGLITMLAKIKSGETKLMILENDGNASPVARVGIERVSMKTDLIPPERMRAVLVKSAKARLLNETGNFVCTNCWDFLEMIKVKDLPNRFTCPRCGSQAIGFLKTDENTALPLIEKKGQRLTKAEERLQNHALETAKLMNKHGKLAAVALSGRRVRTSDIRRLLEKETKLNDRFYELILEAERKTLSRRFR